MFLHINIISVLDKIWLFTKHFQHPPANTKPEASAQWRHTNSQELLNIALILWLTSQVDF